MIEHNEFKGDIDTASTYDSSDSSLQMVTYYISTPRFRLAVLWQ